MIYSAYNITKRNLLLILCKLFLHMKKYFKMEKSLKKLKKKKKKMIKYMICDTDNQKIL